MYYSQYPIESVEFKTTKFNTRIAFFFSYFRYSKLAYAIVFMNTSNLKINISIPVFEWTRRHNNGPKYENKIFILTIKL